MFLHARAILVYNTRALQIADVVTRHMTLAPGHADYAAPEARTAAYTNKIDVYSFGVLLVELCLREAPDVGARADQTSRAAVRFRELSGLMRECLHAEVCACGGSCRRPRVSRAAVKRVRWNRGRVGGFSHMRPTPGRSAQPGRRPSAGGIVDQLSRVRAALAAPAADESWSSSPAPHALRLVRAQLHAARAPEAGRGGVARLGGAGASEAVP